MTTFVIDFLKVPMGSFVAMSLASRILPGPMESLRDQELRSILIFLGAVMGHNFPVWLGFKGGKGIATSAGGLLWLMPKSLSVVAVAWLTVFAISRYVSLASVVASVVLPIGTAYFYGLGNLFWFSCALSVLAIIRHRSNVERLLKGTEHRWEKPPKETLGDSTTSSASLNKEA
jgi:glycerol-3-phosphate acyltransferase PlsY